MLQLHELADFEVLDTPPDAAFDEIVHIAAQVCQTPIAMVSLLDRDRQWFKARVGLDASETPLEQSVCRLEIEQADLLIIADLTEDPRTRENPLVRNDPKIRFYAGAPLVTRSGHAIGRLCVIDTQPRVTGLDDNQRRILTALARQVMVQFEQNRAQRVAADLAELQASLIEVGERIRESISVEDMTFGTAEVVGRTLGAQRAAFGIVHQRTESVTIETNWTDGSVSDIAGTHRFEDYGRLREELEAGEPLVIADVATDPRTRDDPTAMQSLDIGALVNMPVRERGRTSAVLLVHCRKPRRWSEPELAFLRTVADRLEAGVARYQGQQQQDTLNRELSHRMKNMLAMVQAIASQTLGRMSERAPVREFEHRLQALSAAHDVLMQSSWSGAELSAVLQGVLVTFGYGTRVTATGPAVDLGPRAALSLSLLSHELMTNAIKYGALSNEEGHINIDWAFRDRTPKEPELIISWRERGGPAVVEPARKGFGSKLIRLGLVGTGGVSVRYQHLGFEADMTAPLSDLAQS